VSKGHDRFGILLGEKTLGVIVGKHREHSLMFVEVTHLIEHRTSMAAHTRIDGKPSRQVMIVLGVTSRNGL